MKNKPKVDLKKFFCTQPFLYTEFHRSGPKREQYVCCPDWNDINLYDSDNLLDNWNSNKAKQIRKGQLSGNFVGCKPEVCPALNTLVNTGKPGLSIRTIEDYNPEEYDHPSPKRIKVCSDDACNLKCPTCRTELKPNTKFRTARTRGLLDSIEKYYAPTLEEVFTSGGGDPFYSTPMREFLEKIDKVKFPKIKNIMLHTNGILFTPKIWERMKNIHPYVKYVEISVDAATKDTYENKVRLNGKWDVLMDNLKFISTLDQIECIQFDYVVQKVNYNEMIPFIDLIYNIFGTKKDPEVGRYADININFQKVWPWPSIRKEDYEGMCVWKKEHPDYESFFEVIQQVENYAKKMRDKGRGIYHNLHDQL